METPQKMPEPAKVENKTPAEIPIIAEQLSKEAKERDSEETLLLPKQKISHPDDSAAYQHRKRKTFEYNISKNYTTTNWIKYAQWEESQKEIERARSIYERALQYDYRNTTLWLAYTEMEMRNHQMKHARNLWERAVCVLPRVNQLWYKYIHMEEMLENIKGARQVFEQWMEWQPAAEAWQAYINFELKNNEIERTRQIYERFIEVHPDVNNCLNYVRFEEAHGCTKAVRRVYKRAVAYHDDKSADEKLFINFAKFEEKQNEHERARVIYEYALDRVPKDRNRRLHEAYIIHEKKHGDPSSMEDVLINGRKCKYENPWNYDAWFDYLKLNKSGNNAENIRRTYELASVHAPPSKDKKYWERYVYQWINHALFEELETEDFDRCRQIYKTCLLELTIHEEFTFAKMWLMYAKFETRQKNAATARKILEMALEVCPRDKLYRDCIDLEIQLQEFDRCRALYEKFLKIHPENCANWMTYAEMENFLGETERARAIYEMAVSQPLLDTPEFLWEAYINFEIAKNETENARNLFERVLDRTSQFKAWIAYHKFELENTLVEDNIDSVVSARRIFERGNAALRSNGDKENRAILLEAWKEFENEKGDDETLAEILKKMPKRVVWRERIVSDDETEDCWTETIDFVFPDDDSTSSNTKLLKTAKERRKRRKAKKSTKQTSDKKADKKLNSSESDTSKQSEEVE